MALRAFEILRIPVNHRGDWLFIRIDNDDGTFGFGEASHSGDDAAASEAMIRFVEHCVTEGLDTQAALELQRRELPAARIERTALSGVEQALVDMHARQQQCSVAAMLASEQDTPTTQVPLYANLNRMCADREPATVAAAFQTAQAAGIHAVKFAPFDEVTAQSLAKLGDAAVAPGAARLRALREVAGPQTTLMVDCHNRFDHQHADRLASLAQELGVGWLEDPLIDFDQAAIERLRDRSGARIAGGETLLRYDDFIALAKAGTVDVLIADVKFVGGIHELSRICELARRHNIAFAPHNPSGPISTAASAHVVAAYSNAEVLEFPFAEVPWRARFASGELVEGQSLRISDPGLGIELQPKLAGERA